MSLYDVGVGWGGHPVRTQLYNQIYIEFLQPAPIENENNPHQKGKTMTLKKETTKAKEIRYRIVDVEYDISVGNYKCREEILGELWDLRDQYATEVKKAALTTNNRNHT